MHGGRRHGSPRKPLENSIPTSIPFFNTTFSLVSALENHFCLSNRS